MTTLVIKIQWQLAPEAYATILKIENVELDPKAS